MQQCDHSVCCVAPLTQRVASVAEVSDGIHHLAGGRLLLGPAVDTLQQGEDGEDEGGPGGAEPRSEERSVVRCALEQQERLLELEYVGREWEP